MITTSERSKLKSLSNDLRDLVFVGKEGLSNTVIDQIEDNLEAHELLKIKVQKTFDGEINELANTIAKKVNCDIVGVVGSKIILYRYSNRKGVKHIQF